MPYSEFRWTGIVRVSMSQSRKYRGFKTERVVADYLSQWWPGASVGRGAGKDIVNIPMDIEVKARASFSPMEWLRQVNKRTEKTGELSLVCVRMNGQGDSSPEQYLAFLTFGDLVQLLLKAGYGNIQADTVNLTPTRCNKCGSWMIEGSKCTTCRKADNAHI
jgi:hypothetical protein